MAQTQRLLGQANRQVVGGVRDLCVLLGGRETILQYGCCGWCGKQKGKPNSVFAVPKKWAHPVVCKFWRETRQPRSEDFPLRQSSAQNSHFQLFFQVSVQCAPVELPENLPLASIAR